MKKILISPSILSSDFSNLYADVINVHNNGADWIHFDVMDGHFVDNITFGPALIKSITNKIDIFSDVHLMIQNPLKYLKDFIEAKASLITIHYETVNFLEFKKIVKICNDFNVKVGISIKPKTSIFEIENYLSMVDVVLVMSVEPGFGGQKFLNSSIDKIKQLSIIKDKNNYHFLIEVDGGINGLTSKQCIEAGADVLVAGSYIFNSNNRKNAIESLRGDLK